MNARTRLARTQTRRQFLKTCQSGLGAVALAGLLGRPAAAANPLAPRKPDFEAKAKRVIYLHMSGSPPQQDLFDYKPKLVEHHLQP